MSEFASAPSAVAPFGASAVSSPRSGAGYFGRWMRDEWGLPAYRVTHHPDVDEVHTFETGNERLRLRATNQGWVNLVESSRGRRTWFDRGGWAEIDGRATIGRLHPTFGLGYVRYSAADFGGVALDRMVTVPSGDAACVLCRISAHSIDGTAKVLHWVERWPLAPRWLSAPWEPDGMVNGAVPGEADRRKAGASSLRYRRVSDDRTTVVTEVWGDQSAALARDPDGPFVPAQGGQLWLTWREGFEDLGDLRWVAGDRALSSQFRLEVPGDRSVELWFAVGVGDPPGGPATEPLADRAAQRCHVRTDVPDVLAPWAEATLRAQRHDLAQVSLEGVPALERELGWSAAAVRAAVQVDDVAGAQVLDPGGARSDPLGAATGREVARNALALVWLAPELAAASLCSVVATAGADGPSPVAQAGAGLRAVRVPEPADTDLWVLWLAVEYLAATGDMALLDRLVSGWPAEATTVLFPGRTGTDAPGPTLHLREWLRRRLAHLVGVVGVGERGLLRIGPGDGNDLLVPSSPDPVATFDRGESVAATAMARWVLPRYAAVCRRDGDDATADVAEGFAASLAAALADCWTPSGHLLRARLADGTPVGARQLFCEPQTWAILAGDATGREAGLLGRIDAVLRDASPLGARVRSGAVDTAAAPAGVGWNGGVRAETSALLVWAAVVAGEGELARDELGRMLLATHADTYPRQWWGIWGGADGWAAPEAAEPGAAAPAMPGLAGMPPAAAAPSAAVDVHAMTVLATVRTFGIGVAPNGLLRIDPHVAAGGGRLRLPTLAIDVAPSGRTVEGRYRTRAGMQAEVCGELRTFSEGWNTL